MSDGLVEMVWLVRRNIGRQSAAAKHGHCVEYTTTAAGRDVLRRDVAWCGVARRGVVCCGVVWHGVVWCGVVWRGVAWCGVTWCGVA